MKVLLISLNRESEPFTAAPLGLALVASALREAGHEVRALDLLFSGDIERDLKGSIEGFEPGLIGVSLRNVESSTEFLLPAYKDVIARIKELCNVPIVVGGPGFSIMPRQALSYLGLGLGVVGEGEAALVGLARALEEGADPACVPGVCSVKGGEFSYTPAERIEDLSKAPRPAWDLLPVTRYDMVGVQSKRGCSFSCVYCTYPILEGRKLRLRPPAAVAEELEGFAGTTDKPAFYFVDNVFNNPRRHAEDICRAVIERGIDAEWGCLVSPLGLDRPLLELMAKAGCRSVEIGADSLSDRALKGLGKAFGKQDVKKAVADCKAAGMMSMVFLILGGPGEDYDTLMETFDALDEIRPDKVFAVAGIRIYPGTPLARLAVSEGLIKPEDGLLEPAFYVSEGIRGRLYEVAEAFFKAHPGFIYYRADGVTVKARPKPGAGVMAWDRQATECLERVLSEVPRLLRPIAKRAVIRKAGTLAVSRDRASVTDLDVRDAFLSETPGPFQGGMIESLRKLGLLNG